jgi:hypothetical protein
MPPGYVPPTPPLSTRGASLVSYGLHDSVGHTMDCLKVIDGPHGYIGVFHTLVGANVFDVQLATSTDLQHWTFVRTLAAHGSQPTIAPDGKGGYFLAYEADTNGSSNPMTWLHFDHFASAAGLLSGSPVRGYNAPHTLAPLGAGSEGTPSITVQPNGGLLVGFHYNPAQGLSQDRQATGVLGPGFGSWTTSKNTALDGALGLNGVAGNMGQRDSFDFFGTPYTIVEGQKTPGDWGSWGLYLYNGAHALPVDVGSPSTSIANPHVSYVDNGRTMVVTAFVPSEGAAPGQSGSLIYTHSLQPYISNALDGGSLQ